MAKLENKEIFHRGKDLVCKIRSQGDIPAMRMCCVLQVTGMEMEDLAAFIVMGLIRVDRQESIPVLLIEDVLSVVQKALHLKKTGLIG